MQIDFLGRSIAPLGMGCWAIGGPFFGDDMPLGFANADDAQAIRTIHAALDSGIRLFDTADVYGAGHSETLLGQALAGRDDIVIVSKFGFAFDAATKKVTGARTDAGYVEGAIEASLKRLGRERIDLMLLHVNTAGAGEVEPILDALTRARDAGKIGAFGWSCDFPEAIAAVTPRTGFAAVEHAMNVFSDVPTMAETVRETDLWALNRSPLAMGVLTGKFDAQSHLPGDDVRANDLDWMDYFKGGRVAPAMLRNLDAVRDSLRTGGRTLAQGAIGWLWAKSARNIPIPGAKTVAQAEENAGALAHGPLPADVMAEIESLIERAPEGPARER